MNPPANPASPVDHEQQQRDKRQARRMHCPGCAARRLDYVPLVTEDGEYRPLAICAKCGESVRLAPAPPEPQPEPKPKARPLVVVVAPQPIAPMGAPCKPILGGQSLLDARQVCAYLSIGKRTLWRMIERAEFPQPIRFNRKTVRWSFTALEAWLAEQRSGAA